MMQAFSAYNSTIVYCAEHDMSDEETPSQNLTAKLRDRQPAAPHPAACSCSKNPRTVPGTPFPPGHAPLPPRILLPTYHSSLARGNISSLFRLPSDVHLTRHEKLSCAAMVSIPLSHGALARFPAFPRMFPPVLGKTVRRERAESTLRRGEPHAFQSNQLEARLARSSICRILPRHYARPCRSLSESSILYDPTSPGNASPALSDFSRAVDLAGAEWGSFG
jgi:hypothetical protein